MSISIKDLGLVEYQQTYDLMRDFNAARQAETADEIWLLEHQSVYTLGLAGKHEHVLNTAGIPVVETDRGGQVTYHGPGQLVAYLLIDLSQRPYAIKRFVKLIEQAIIDYLSSLGIDGERRVNAPGVYVDDKKIAALGVRVKRGCTYHGLALNVDMDLEPFNGINPCGYRDLQCTQIKDYVSDIDIVNVKKQFPEFLIQQLDVRRQTISDVA